MKINIPGLRPDSEYIGFNEITKNWTNMCYPVVIYFDGVTDHVIWRGEPVYHPDHAVQEASDYLVNKLKEIFN